MCGSSGWNWPYLFSWGWSATCIFLKSSNPVGFYIVRYNTVLLNTSRFRFLLFYS
jgi:hypothetical protein